MDATLAVAVTGIGEQVLLELSDNNVYTVERGVIYWSSNAPEQLEAIIHDVITANVHGELQSDSFL